MTNTNTKTAAALNVNTKSSLKVKTSLKAGSGIVINGPAGASNHNQTLRGAQANRAIA